MRLLYRFITATALKFLPQLLYYSAQARKKKCLSFDFNLGLKPFVFPFLTFIDVQAICFTPQTTYYSNRVTTTSSINVHRKSWRSCLGSLPLLRWRAVLVNAIFSEIAFGTSVVKAVMADYKAAPLATLPKTLDPKEYYNLAPEFRRAEEDRLALRANLKRQYLLQLNNPLRKEHVVSACYPLTSNVTLENGKNKTKHQAASWRTAATHLCTYSEPTFNFQVHLLSRVFGNKDKNVDAYGVGVVNCLVCNPNSLARSRQVINVDVWEKFQIKTQATLISTTTDTWTYYTSEDHL